MTYSFPCQDLSLAGKQAGMGKGSGTRSGMLWEVERILDECEREQRPQVLIMENVPEVIGSKNIQHFAKWLEKLESLGYHCYWQVLNGKDYGVPQNRERCFMVSVLGDYFYEFPNPIPLEHKLKDLLEDNVDEKYYLSDKMIDGMAQTTFESYKLENKVKGAEDVADTIVARFDGAPQCVCINGKEILLKKDTENYIEWKQKGFLDADCRAWKEDTVIGALTTTCGKSKILKTELCNKLIKENKVQEYDVIRHSYTNNRLSNGEKNMGRIENHDGLSPTLDTRCDCLGAVKDYRIRKLTPRECFRLMGVKDNDFDKIAKNQSNASLYHLAGDSIIVDVLMAIFKNML